MRVTIPTQLDPFLVPVLGPQSPYYRAASPVMEEPHYQFPSDGSQLYDLPLVGIQETQLDYSKSFDNPGYYASILDLHNMADLHSTADQQPNARETTIVCILVKPTLEALPTVLTSKYCVYHPPTAGIA